MQLKHLKQFKRPNCSPVLPVFLIDFSVEVLLNLLKVNGVRLELGLAEVEMMLMGDCRVPPQYNGVATGHVLSSINKNKTPSSKREAAAVTCLDDAVAAESTTHCSLTDDNTSLEKEKSKVITNSESSTDYV